MGKTKISTAETKEVSSTWLWMMRTIFFVIVVLLIFLIIIRIICGYYPPKDDTMVRWIEISISGIFGLFLGLIGSFFQTVMQEMFKK